MQNKAKSRLILAGLVVVTAGLVLLSAFGIGSGQIFSIYNIKQGLDLQGGVSVLFEAEEESPTTEDMNAAVGMLRRRLDSENYMDADVARQGTKQIRVDIPDVDDPEEAVAIIGKTALLLFADDDWNVLLTGAEVANARVGVNTQGNTSDIVVNLELTSYGAAVFEEATRANIDRPIHIILDDEIISSPMVRSVIPDGRCFIEGGFNTESAEYLARLIREGSLPFSLAEISRYTIGARLGADALETSIIAGIIGLILVFIFMAYFYRVSGLAADLALIIYAALMLLLLSVLRLTLTLPGIAGIILSIGMAVDANVVIFERIREEINAGRTLRAAIDAGYKRAFPAIFDSNITSLIASIILFALGTGPVKSFAQTLSFGIVLSMFSALVVTKWITINIVGSGLKKINVFIPIPKDKDKPAAKPTFIEWRKYAYIASAVLVLVGVSFSLVNELQGRDFFNLDVEFSGGTTFLVDIGGPFDNDDIMAIVQDATGQMAPQVQTANVSEVMIKITSTDPAQRNAIIEELMVRYDIPRENIQDNLISATVSADMQRTAILAALLALISMLVYVSFRFRDIRMGASTVLAVLHNLLLVVAAYAVLRIPLNYSFIAVLLTIIGYSINSNIIIFDRVRENRSILRRETAAELVNISVTQTLRRTVFSSLTTLLAILCLFIIGVPSIKEFTLPLIIGLVVGAYASVFLAGGFWYTLGRGRKSIT